MDDFNVNITITDTINNGCCNNTVQKTVIISSSAQTIALQNCYILNVIAISQNMFTVLIQNGTQVIVRNIYTNFITDLPLPSNCKRHLLSISGVVVPK